MRTGIVTPGYEWNFLFGEASQRTEDVAQTLDPGRIVRRANDDEVVPHQRLSVVPIPGFDKLHFGGRRVDEENIDVPSSTQFQRFSGTDGEDLDAMPRGSLFEVRCQLIEEATVVERGCRAHAKRSSILSGTAPSGAKQGDDHCKPTQSRRD